MLGAGIGALVGGARQPFASDASGLPIGYGRGQVDPKLAKAAITGSVSNVAKNVPEAKTISAELLNALKLGGTKGDENLLFRSCFVFQETRLVIFSWPAYLIFQFQHLKHLAMSVIF